MSSQKFGQLKRKVYFAYHRDGILDLIAGSVVLGFGTFMLTENIAFLMAGWFVMMMYIFLKKRITVPRLGFVRIDSEKTALVRSWTSVGIGVLVLMLFFLLPFFLRRAPASPGMEAWLRRYHMVPLSIMLFALPALGVGLFLGIKRFYLYALLAAGLPLLGAWLNIETYLPIMTTGGVMLVLGVGLLVSFLQKYPRDMGGEGARE